MQAGQGLVAKNHGGQGLRGVHFFALQAAGGGGQEP